MRSSEGGMDPRSELIEACHGSLEKERPGRIRSHRVLPFFFIWQLQMNGRHVISYSAKKTTQK